MLMQSAIFNVLLFMILFSIARIISDKTKGIILEPLFLSVVYLVCFMTGILPTDGLDGSGIPTMMTAFGLFLIVTNLGTMIELRRLFHEWRTVLICLGSMAVMAVLFYTVGIAVYGRHYALSALPPVAGALVAGTLVVQAAEAAGMPQYGAFAMLIVSLQSFVSVPIATIMMRKYTKKMVAEGTHLADPIPMNKSWPNFKLIKSWPRIFSDSTLMVTRLFIVCFIAILVSLITGGAIPVAVAMLVLGIVFTEIGFLEPQTLSRSGYLTFMMMALMMTIPVSYKTITWDGLVSMLLPLLFFLVLGVVGLTIGGLVVGKLVKVDWRLSVAIALSAMFGYPLTEFVARAVVTAYHLPPEEEEKMLNNVMPQLIIAGFASVSIASVFLAGVVAPTIFK